MSKKEQNLTMIGYNCKGLSKRYITCTYLTAKKQEKFIKYWHKEIEPLLNKKIDELKTNNIKK